MCQCKRERVEETGLPTTKCQCKRERVETGLLRTNSHVEGWHNRFKNMTNAPHEAYGRFCFSLREKWIVTRKI